jgi:N utilization substance protein B
LGILYFWEVGRAEADEAVEEYFRLHAPDATEAVRTFAAELVRGTIADVESLDALIARHAENWRIDRLAVIDRLILRMASWELTHDSVRFVNGVLDGIRRTLAEA